MAAFMLHSIKNLKLKIQGTFQFFRGARQFLEGLKEACGKIRCQRSLRQKVSKHIRASSPIWDQNWPGRLNRH